MRHKNPIEKQVHCVNYLKWANNHPKRLKTPNTKDITDIQKQTTEKAV